MSVILAKMDATTIQQTRISEIGAFLKPDESIMIFEASFFNVIGGGLVVSVGV